MTNVTRTLRPHGLPAWQRSLALAALVTLCVACGPSSAADPRAATGFVLVTAPADAAEPADPVRDPSPAGSRLVRLRAARSGEPIVPLLDDVAAVALCDVSPDGQRLLVTLQDAPGDPWRVHELPAAGGTPRPVSPFGASTVAAAWLPGERVVLASDLAGTLDPRDGGPAFHLYTCNADGSELQRISFNPSSDVDPVVLPDGRILFAAWQPPGSGRPTGGFALFSVRDDGTGLAAWSGSHDDPADLRRPRLLGEDVVCLGGGAGHEGLVAVARRRPLHARRDLASEHPGAWRSATRGADGRLVLCGLPPDASPASRSGLHLAGPSGLRALDVAPDAAVLDVRALAPRPAPRGHLSTVDPTATTGELLCLDARHAELPPDAAGGPPAASVASRASTLQVLRGVPARAGRDSAAPSARPIPTPSETLATLALQQDGSAWMTVPADTPLRFRTLDDEGHVLLDSTSWIWVRPGESRSCIGCHEDRERAPPNRAPAALAGEPFDATVATAQEDPAW